MTQYIALTYTADVDWSAPEQADEMRDYGRFGQEHAEAIRGGAALYRRPRPRRSGGPVPAAVM